MKARFAVVALVALFAVSCWQMQVRIPFHKRTVLFNKEDYAPYDQPGNASIEGQIFARTNGGGIVYAAGLYVFVEPMTEYSSEWVQYRCNLNMRVSPPDVRLLAYQHRTLADDKGRFKFDGLAAGKYYIYCNLTWNTGGGLTGGYMVHAVALRAGDAKSVTITNPYAEEIYEQEIEYVRKGKRPGKEEPYFP